MTDSLFREKTISALVSALIYQLAGAYLSGERSALSAYSARSVEITKNFKLLLRRHYLEWRKPIRYAESMNINATHLNDTIKAVTGFPVTYHIQQEVMREARRLLAYSDLSVKEIAAALNFEDAKYFSRLIRKVYGKSALDLRS